MSRIIDCFVSELRYVITVGSAAIYTDLPNPSPTVENGKVTLANGTIIFTDRVGIKVSPTARPGYRYTVVYFGPIGEPAPPVAFEDEHEELTGTTILTVTHQPLKVRG